MKYTLYRKKYTIAVYGPVKNGEPLLCLCDTISEFAKFMKIKESNAAMILNKLFHQKQNYIKYNNSLCEVAFINLND